MCCSQPRILQPKYILLLALIVQMVTSCRKPQDENVPQALDQRLRMEVILESPDIMTPIGITIDDQDNLYVLESHTHFPRSDYKGQKFDRIKKGINENGNGRPDRWVVYADDLDDGMNIEWHAGSIYLVEKDSVFRITDTDNDGMADQKEVLVQMKTAQGVFDHAGLLGITIGVDGWIYVSKGNSAGIDLEIMGSDGSKIASYGAGGSVFRCKLDGSKVEEIATGFWNPFDIKFLRSGKLMLVDNDPDSRGPNRLVEVVPGGDYGYQSMYGGSGLHPFLAWNGELPGTLPYAAGIGEAPSGLIDASYSNFPVEYQGNVLATIWEENSIVKIPLESFNSTVRGESEILVQGDSLFHPVALAANSKGDIFITDWVLRQYPNHGYGRLLMLTSDSGKPIDPGVPEQNAALSMLESPPDIDNLFAQLSSEDPFVRTVSRELIIRGGNEARILNLLDHQDKTLRLEGLLMLNKSDIDPGKEALRNLLYDESVPIRKMTLIYLATHLRADMYDEIIGTLAADKITVEMFETYLEAVKYLQPDFIQQFKARTKPVAKQIKVELPENFIAGIIQDPTLSDNIKSLALPYLEEDDNSILYLLQQLEQSGADFQKAILKKLRTYYSETSAEAFLKIAIKKENDPEVRAQALLNLELQGGSFCNEVTNILQEEDQLVVEAATRYLCRCRGEYDEKIKSALKENPAAMAVRNQCSGVTPENRPGTHEEWLAALNGDGSVLNGWMIFQSPRAQCISCHQVNKWGGVFGPDLSTIASSKSKEQLIYAVLQPDKEIAPEWQGWYVKDKEGVTHLGRQIDVGDKNAELMVATGEFINFKEIQAFGTIPNSLMPDGLENQLTVGEMNDLVTFLMSLR